MEAVEIISIHGTIDGLWWMVNGEYWKLNIVYEVLRSSISTFFVLRILEYRVCYVLRTYSIQNSG